MRLAQITPPQWNSLYHPGEDYRMALAHWVLKNDAYVLAMRYARAAGGYTILDNGSFEGEQVSNGELNEACLKIAADEVVLPDAQGDPGASLSRSWAALGKLDVKRVMFVPQGTTQEERINCLRAWIKKWEGSEFKDRYALAIGVTSLRQTKGERSPRIGTRASLLEEIASPDLEYPLHLLGMPSPTEFIQTEAELGRALNVRGVDTSIAFALGAEGKLLTPSQPKVHLKDPDAYEALNTHQRRLIRLNQRILHEWVNTTGCDERIPTYWIRQTASKWFTYYAEGFETLETIMTGVGMPRGRYALLKVRRREKYVRPLRRGEKLREKETEVKL